MRTKICCISSPEEAAIAGAAGADYLGLVGPMPNGPGILTLEKARNIARRITSPARPVLLTAAQTANAITAEAAFVGVRTVQVVRPIPAQEAEALGNTDLHYIQVIHMETEAAFDTIATYAPHCDMFLLDSGKPSAGTLGGTGNVHDWTLSAEFVHRSPLPVFLAGGLTPQNAADAIRTVRPVGLDICSGLRGPDGLDPAKLAAFMASTRPD